MKKSIPFFILFIVTAGVLVLDGIGQSEDRTYDAVLSTQIEQNNLIPVSLIVGEERYEVQVSPGSSVYDLMKYAEAQNGLEFKGRSFSGMGFFIEEIQGKAQNNRAGMYWIYSINGKKAEVGVSNYIIQPNDVISWSYEQSY